MTQTDAIVVALAAELAKEDAKALVDTVANTLKSKGCHNWRHVAQCAGTLSHLKAKVLVDTLVNTLIEVEAKALLNARRCALRDTGRHAS